MSDIEGRIFAWKTVQGSNSSIFVNAISIYCTHACSPTLGRERKIKKRQERIALKPCYISHCIHVRFIKEEFVAFSMDFNLFHDCKECLFMLHLHFVFHAYSPRIFGHSLDRSFLLHSWFNIISLKNALQWTQPVNILPSSGMYKERNWIFFIYK